MATVFSDYDDSDGRRVTVVAFLIVLLFFVMAFSFVPMPSQEFADRVVEVVMLEQMMFESIEDISTVDEEEPGEELLAVEPEATTLADEAEATVTEDLKKLMSAFGDFAFSEVALDDAELKNNIRPGAPTVLDQGELDVDSDNILGEFGSRSIDLTSDLVTNSEGEGRTTRQLRTGLLSDGASGNVGRPGFRRLRESGTGDKTGTSAIFSERAIPDLLEHAKEGPETEKREVDFSVPINPLVAWMKLRQAPLDPGIRSLFRFSTTDITSNEQIAIGGKPYGLQLLHSPGSGAVHIALIDGDTIYYFIDPGFQRRANYFQKGTVRRDEATLVVLVESEDFSPQGPDAKHFFDLFLSWWAQEDFDL